MTQQLGCETARRRRLEVGGLGLHCLEWGAPADTGVLLLHGGAAHVHWFDLVGPGLADRRHVVAIDQRGHGESDWAVPPAYATEDFVDDVVRVLDRLGWARAAIVGHSMGGHNAMACAAWHPERVRALVILDARPAVPPERLAQMRARGDRPPRRHPTLEAAVAAFRLLPPETLASPALLDHLARAAMAWRDGTAGPRFDPACYAARKPADAWPLLPRIAAPTLVVRGERSPILPRDVAERVCAEIPAARLVEIPEAYHHLVLDRPGAVIAAVRAFLDGLAPAGGAPAAPPAP